MHDETRFAARWFPVLAPLLDIRYAALISRSPTQLMNPTPARPVTTAVSIQGPSGDLEALLDSPVEARGVDVNAVAAAAVICHPHPQFGGTMTNKVVHTLAKSFNELGVPAVRFNYRGVGASAGSYDEGNGETDDAVAVLDWARERWPQAELWLGGFSFGGAVAIRAAVRRDVRRLVTVAPAITRVAVDDANLPQCPWLLVQGDSDELVDCEEVLAWVRSLRAAPHLAVLAGVDHFFHGKLNDLREAVLQWSAVQEQPARRGG